MPGYRHRVSIDGVESIRIDILGPWEIRAGDRVVEIPRGQLRLLLASLVLSPNEPVGVATLTARAWPEHTPERARATLHTYATRLRKLLGPGVIETARGTGYRLAVPEQSVDLHRFRSLVARAHESGTPEQELDGLRRALALWRGKPFGDEPSTWLDLEVVPQLVEEWFVATERRIDLELDLATGPAGRLIPELRELTERFPTRESLWARLVTALYRSDRRAEALEAYQSVRAILADELGIDPGEQLVRLQQAILRDESLPLPAPAPAPAAMPRQLPHDIARVIGRDDELALLDKLGCAPAGGVPAIVAIDGAAGTGKTTLAVHWAHRVAHQYPEIQLFLNLRGYGPGEPVTAAAALETLLRALGTSNAAIPAGVDERAALLRSTLAGRPALILLDNARDANQVRPLLPATNALVIVTSRNQLRGLSVRDGAHRVTLDVLGDGAAVELLTTAIGADRAAAEPGAVRRLAELCDHLPLALAIVAERAHRGAGLAEMVRSLTDEAARLDALAGGTDDPDTDLRAALSWSYAALAPDAAVMLRRLGAHPTNDIALETAAALADVPVPAAKASLDRLVAGHLVEQRRPNHYELHDLVRLYAVDLAQRYDSEPDWCAAVTRMLDHYLHAADAADRKLAPNRRRAFLGGYRPQRPPPVFADEAAATAWFEDEYDSLRSVLCWAASNGRPDYVWRTAMALTTFFDARIPWRDGLEFFETAVTAAQDAGERFGYAYSLNSVGCIHLDRLALTDATRCFEGSLEAFAEIGDERGVAILSNNLAMVHGEAGHPEQAHRHASRALEICERLGHRRGTALSLDSLGVAYTVAGDLDRAIACFGQALVIFTELGDIEVATTQRNLGVAHRRRGEYTRSVRALRAAITVLRRTGNRRWEAIALVELARTLRAAGHPALARHVIGSIPEWIADVDDPRALELEAAVAELAA